MLRCTRESREVSHAQARSACDTARARWNLSNRFTGWTDVDLTPQGVSEAEESARLLKEDGGYTFDVAYTSVLTRAIRTLWIVLDGMD